MFVDVRGLKLNTSREGLKFSDSGFSRRKDEGTLQGEMKIQQTRVAYLQARERQVLPSHPEPTDTWGMF